MTALPLVKLYSKPDCHLCEQAEALLARLRPRLPHQVEKLDIQSDPALFERYRYSIPVLVVGDREYAAPLDEALVARALAETR